MTDKQFQLFIGDNYGVQTVDGEVIFDSICSIAEADILVEWLNDITNRNKELKHENEQLKANYNSLSHNNGLLYDECKNKINDLKKKNEQLKKWLKSIHLTNNVLKENERLKKENKNLKAQLYSDDEEGICNQCKYHYLVKDEDSEFGYYNSRCRKGHYECARISLRYCNDFEIKNGDFE